MKKITIILSISLLFLVNTKGISQRTKQVNDRDSIKHWEVGFDLLWLIDKNTVPAKSVFLRYNFENSRGAKRALRFRIGADYKSLDTLVHATQLNDEIGQIAGFVRVGYEWQRSLSRNTGFYYALDVSSSYLKIDSDIIRPIDGWNVKNTDKTWELGTIGVLGFIYKPSSRFAISVESSLNLIYRKRNEDSFGSYPERPEDEIDHRTSDISRITTIISPISVINFSFKF